MKPNMGTLDKALRVIAALVISILYFTNQVTGITAIILMVLAGIFILTGLIGVCPLYLPFRISTRKHEQAGKV